MKKGLLLILFFSGIMMPVFCNAQVYVITTLAGDSIAACTGDGGLADTAKLKAPSGVATDRHGNVYIADQSGNSVRKVNAAGIISTVAGNYTYGYSGDSALATSAQLANPTGVAVDRYGNIYIADQYNSVIRKVDTNGIITTFAGSGTLGFGGDGGSATSDSAKLWSPADVGVDSFGNVYIVDQDNQRIRKVDTSGIITTFAGNGITGFGGDSGLAINAQLNFPEGIAVDRSGNVYIADLYNSRIRYVNQSGIITTVAGNGTGGYGGDDSLATLAEIYDASAVGLDDSGNIYISDYYNERIRKVNKITGIITTIAGNGVQGYSGDNGPATLAEIFWPEGVAVDSSGNVFVADYGNHRVREIKITDSVTAIKKIPEGSFKVFPNPSKGLFTIRTNLSQNSCNVGVYNMVGEKVYRSDFNTSEFMIDLSGMPAGIYMLYITSEHTTTVQKLVISY